MGEHVWSIFILALNYFDGRADVRYVTVARQFERFWSASSGRMSDLVADVFAMLSRRAAKLSNLRQMLFHKFLDGEWMFGLL
jgi:hypothetical protein